MSEKIVIVETYENPHEADMAKQFLEGEGILVFLDNRFIVEALWHLSNAVGNIRLQVPRDQAERAYELLKAQTHRWSGLENGEPLNEEELKCMECGELMGEEEEKCSACGWSYGNVKEAEEAEEAEDTEDTEDTEDAENT